MTTAAYSYNKTLDVAFMSFPASVSYPSLCKYMLLGHAACVWIAGDSEWNSRLDQLHNSTFINRLCVRCMRHKQLCGRSLHWLAWDSPLCAFTTMTGYRHRNHAFVLVIKCACLMKMDLVRIIKFQEFKCSTIRRHLWYLTNHVIPLSLAWCIHCWSDLHTYPLTLVNIMSTDDE